MYRHSVVKSVQRGTVTIANGSTTGTATITSVAMGNSILSLLEASNNSAAAHVSIDAKVTLMLTSATVVTATRFGSTGDVTVGFDVMELVPGVVKSIQRGTITLSSTSTTATVTAVVTTSSLLMSLGQFSNAEFTASEQPYQWSLITLTSSTVITATRNSTGFSAITQNYQLVEFV